MKKNKRRYKVHYCSNDKLTTPCGRHWIDVKTTPLADLRFISCERCKKHIQKLRRRKYVYIP